MPSPASRREPPSYETVKRLALALPEVAESTSYGTPALKVKDKLMIRLTEDGETLVLRTTWESRERRMTIYPEAFYLTDHYRNYRTQALVLACIGQVPPGVLNEVVREAWAVAAPKAVLKRWGESVTGAAAG